MKVQHWGAKALGVVLLVLGLVILVSGVDPMQLCGKQCGIPRMLAQVLGTAGLRVLIGAFFAGLGLLFLLGRPGRR